MFIKKRKDLPKAPDGADGEYGLFKERKASRGQASDVADVVDVEAVETRQASTTEEAVRAEPAPAASGIKIKRKVPADKTATLTPAEVVVEAPADKPPVSKKAPFQFFSGRTPREKASVREPGSQPEAKPSRTPGLDTSYLDLVIGMDDGTRVFWRLGESSLEEISQEEVTLAASFSAQDFRLKADGLTSYPAAHDLALSEVGEDVRIVYKPKSRSVAYATPTARVSELNPTCIAPGAMLVDSLLRDDWEKASDLVCCVLLKTGEGVNGLAILYHGTPDGELSRPQISVNPDNLNFLISQFAAALKLDLESTKVVVLSNKDLLSVGAGLIAYPSEGTWRGYPISRVWSAMATMCSLLAVSSAAFAGYSYFELLNAEKNKAAYTVQLNTSKSKLNDLISSSLNSFSKAQSLNLDLVTERAGAVWTPGGKVSVEATTKHEKYVTTLPLLSKGAEVGGVPTVLNQKSMDNIEPLIKMAAPEGCGKSAPEISGGLNVVQSTVNCENSDGTLNRYSPD